MKNKFYLGVIIVSIALMSCRKNPKMYINYEHLNDRTKQQSITIFNTGNAPLIIEDYVTSCDCTALNLKKNKSLNSGDSLRVSFEIDTLKKVTGQRIYITIKTNAKPQLTSFSFKTI